jgi:hypothetical protein
MKNRFLPIGSVVLLKGGTKKAMITGYCPVTEEDPNNMFDYRGCPFPEGIMMSEGSALFNHDQIEEVVHTGWENEESINFIDKLEILLENEGK